MTSERADSRRRLRLRPLVPVLALGLLVAAGVPLLLHRGGAASRRVLDSGARRSTPTHLLAALPDFKCRAVAKDDRVSQELYPVPRPPFSKDIFPCSRCHDRPDDFNPTKRNLTLQHRNIKLVHGPRQQWCYDCHNPSKRDTLRLAGGREVSFTKSYELCGQCHGTKLRDWRLGVHGRRIGCWNGKRQYLLCVHCHDPHAPRFRPLEPLPGPTRPSEIQLHDRHEGSQR